MNSVQQITGLLETWHDQPDDPKAAEALARRVYSELYAMACRRRPLDSADHFSPTELVHEAWLRLEATDKAFRDRHHFFRLAALCMRHLMIDLARQRIAAKRGGELQRITLDGLASDTGALVPELIDLDRALERLERNHPRHAEVVILRCFGGLSLADIAELIEVSLATVKRDWKFARAWLLASLGESQDA